MPDCLTVADIGQQIRRKNAFEKKLLNKMIDQTVTIEDIASSLKTCGAVINLSNVSVLATWCVEHSKTDGPVCPYLFLKAVGCYTEPLVDIKI